MRPNRSNVKFEASYINIINMFLVILEIWKHRSIPLTPEHRVFGEGGLAFARGALGFRISWLLSVGAIC